MLYFPLVTVDKFYIDVPKRELSLDSFRLRLIDPCCGDREPGVDDGVLDSNKFCFIILEGFGGFVFWLSEVSTPESSRFEVLRIEIDEALFIDEKIPLISVLCSLKLIRFIKLRRENFCGREGEKDQLCFSLNVNELIRRSGGDFFGMSRDRDADGPRSTASAKVDVTKSCTC